MSLRHGTLCASTPDGHAMHDAIIHLLDYRPDPVPVPLRDAALAVARECGYDRWEEFLLEARVTGVRWVAAASVEARFMHLCEPCGWPTDEIVRIDWHTWATPSAFDPDFRGPIVERCESVIVAAQVVLAGEVSTYGLGPEYNWLHWEESPARGPVPPPDLSDSLCDLIRGPWRHSVLEAFGSDGEARIERVHPKLRGAVAEVIGASR